VIAIDDNDQLRELAGELGAHLKMIARAMNVDVDQRGGGIVVRSANGRLDEVERLVRGLHGLVKRGFPLHATDVDHAIRIVRSDPRADLATYFTDTVVVGVGNRPIAPKTANQRRYVEALRRSSVVFGVGPAGTGKTYLAMAMAVASLVKGDVKRLILSRPAVEAGEKLGFLPGDLTEKVDPYLRPLYDAMNDMLTPDKMARLIEKRVIEVAPLAFMRGRTLADAHIILDEAQNTTVEQMRMFLTRLGDRSRMTITGDDTQIDLPPARTSGLVHALRVLDNVDGIDVIRFDRDDVVRHPLVASIVDAYAADDARRRARSGSEP
jgi:phosphate starvation-inducible PhoH-like protein